MRCRSRALPVLLVLALAVVGGLAAPASEAHNASTVYPVRWPAYSTNPFVIDIFFAKRFPATKFAKRIKSATKAWNTLDRGPHFKTHFDTTKKAVDSPCDDLGNRQGRMQYESIPGSAIALTQRCIVKQDGYPRRMRSFSISLDSDEKKAWNRSTGASHVGNTAKADVWAVTTHELGHALGSNDYLERDGNGHCVDDTRRETMCKIYFRGHERERTLGTHDKQTFRDAYPSPVWWADAERGRHHEWASAANQECSTDPTATAPTTSAHKQGNRTWNLRVQDGWDTEPDGFVNPDSTRCELANDNPGKPGFPLYHEGDDLWFSWWVRPESNFKVGYQGGANPCIAKGPRDFQAISQWKQQDGHGAPAVAMGILSNRYCLTNSADNQGSSDTGQAFNLGAANLNIWARFTLHEHIGPANSGSRAGSIHLCGDLGDGLGWRELAPTTATWTTKYASGGSGPSLPVHSRIGIYRGKNLGGDENMRYDGYTVATSRTVAEKNAFGAALASTPCSEAGGSYALP